MPALRALALAVALACALPAAAQQPAPGSAAAAEAKAATLPPVDAPKPSLLDRLRRLNPFAGKPRAEPPTGVQDPHYGDSLFYFFQDRYFSAVTTLMVSQHFARMPVHTDEAEVLRGGLFLSYGLHREAGEVFARLIERNAPPQVRDRAWYYLAKIRYQRGLVDQAIDAMTRIEGTLPADLQEDRVLLQANLLMARADYAGAMAVLDAYARAADEKTQGGASLYARYNLGVAMVRAGDAPRGSTLLDQIGQAPVAGEEMRSLRDKANVALGFSALQAGSSERARQALQRVRLDGMLANKALLGFGWAAAEQKKLALALTPWTELAARDASDPAVLEAKLAVPYAYAELGAYGQALERYQHAIEVFDQENTHLDESIAAIRGGALLASLLERNPGEEMGWFWNIAELPALPHAAHLAPVLAQHEFQEAFKNWRDLLFLGRNLQQWEEKLGAMRDMLATRRQAFTERLPAVRAGQGAIDLQAAGRNVAALRAELDRAARDGDAAALADARELELQQRLDRVQATLERTARDPALFDLDIDRARERQRRAAGALRWQQVHEFPARLWLAQKTLAEAERNLAQAQARDAALASAQRDEPGRLEAFARRIDALAARVQTMQPQVAALAAEQQAAVQELAVAELVKQKERLAAHGAQARFAVAQLYDRANLSSGEPRAAAPQ